jgi:hypothetical protein
VSVGGVSGGVRWEEVSIPEAIGQGARRAIGDIECFCLGCGMAMVAMTWMVWMVS